MQHRLLSIDQPLEWNRALDGMTISPAHCHAYQKAISESSEVSPYLYVGEEGDLKIACPIALRSYLDTTDLYTPYGFGGFATTRSDIGFLEKWNSWARSQGYICGYVGQHPCLELNLPTDSYSVASTTYSLDLKLSDEDLLKKMHKTSRYELLKWQEKKLEVIDDKEALRTCLPELYKQTLLRVGASSVYHFNDRTLSQLLDWEGCTALGVFQEGKVEAICVFLHSAGLGEYFLNASSLEGRLHTRGILWSSLAFLRARGVNRLHLGGGARPGDSLDAFKRRLGGDSHPYQVFKQVYRPEEYSRICTNQGLTPQTGGFFPAYRAPKTLSA